MTGRGRGMISRILRSKVATILQSPRSYYFLTDDGFRQESEVKGMRTKTMHYYLDADNKAD